MHSVSNKLVLRGRFATLAWTLMLRVAVVGVQIPTRHSTPARYPVWPVSIANRSVDRGEILRRVREEKRKMQDDLGENKKDVWLPQCRAHAVAHLLVLIRKAVFHDFDQRAQVRQHCAAHENGNLLDDLDTGVTRLQSHNRFAVCSYSATTRHPIKCFKHSALFTL